MKTTTPFVRLMFAFALLVGITATFMVSPTVLGGRMIASEPLSRHCESDDCLPKYPPPPVVKIRVSVPARSEPGRDITYKICVENCSSAEAHHVIVKNALPSNAKFVKSDPEPSKQGAEIQWNLGTIGGGATREIILVLQPTNKDDIKNCIRVVFEHGQCVVTKQNLPPGDRKPIIEVVPDAPVLDLSIRGPKEQYINLATKYQVTVTNTSKTPATRTLVAAKLPKTLKVVRASDDAAVMENETAIAWNLGTLAPGASKTLEMTLKAAGKGEHCFKIEAEADHGAKKEIEWCTKFAGVSAMTLEMTDSIDPLFVGQKTSYPIKIVSQGSEVVTNIRLRAFVPDGLRFDRSDPPAHEKREPGVGGEWIEFKTLPRLEAGTRATYEIFVDAVKGGRTVFRIAVDADQLIPGRPVIEEESTTVVDDREKK